jgi:hypothetical protein
MSDFVTGLPLEDDFDIQNDYWNEVDGWDLYDDFSDWDFDDGEYDYDRFIKECQPRQSWRYVVRGIKEGAFSLCSWCHRPNWILWHIVGDHHKCLPF